MMKGKQIIDIIKGLSILAIGIYMLSVILSVDITHFSESKHQIVNITKLIVSLPTAVLSLGLFIIYKMKPNRKCR